MSAVARTKKETDAKADAELSSSPPKQGPKDVSMETPLLEETVEVKVSKDGSDEHQMKEVEAKTNEVEDAKKENDEQRMIWKIRESVRERKTFALIVAWTSVVIPFYTEIIGLVGIMYYVDVILDFKTIYIFLSKAQYKYAGINISAVVLANVYCAVDMVRLAGDEYGASMFAVGYLMPIFGHIALLCVISLRRRKKHPLLAPAKLAESALEAGMSAFVQTYALIYSRWEDNNEFLTVALSTLSSFLSIGYAFMCFDRQDIGLSGVPGALTGASFSMMLVMMARVAEISSRIVSLAIFGVATRGLLVDPEGQYSESTFGQLAIMACFTTAIPSLLFLDLLVLSLLTSIYQRKNIGNCINAVPSLLGFMNPLLEKGNPCSMPASVYYGWRVLELAGMGGFAWYLNGTAALVERFEDDIWVVKAMFVMTIIWMMLIPLIRICLASHVILTYTQTMLSVSHFNRSQALLRDELLNAGAAAIEENANGYKAMPCELDKESAPKELDPSVSVMQKMIIQTLKDATDELKTAVQQNMKKKFLKQIKADQHHQGEACNTEEEANDALALPIPTQFCRLYDWAETQIQDYDEKKRQHAETDQIFSRLLTIGANLLPQSVGLEGQWRSSIGKERHLEILQCLRTASSKRSVQEKALSQIDELIEVLPGWQQWRNEEIDLALHKEKWLLIEHVGTRGWDTQACKFLDDALKLHVALDTQVREIHDMKKSHWEACAPAQARALVRLWRSIPLTTQEKQSRCNELRKLFRTDVEWEAMIVGARIALDQKGSSAWEADELLQFCAAASEAIEAGFAFTPLGLKAIDDIQRQIERHAKDKVDNLFAKYDRVRQEGKKESKELKKLHATFETSTKKVLSKTDYPWAHELQQFCKAKTEEALFTFYEYERKEKERIAAEKMKAEEQRKIEEARRKEEEEKRKEEEEKRKEAEEVLEEVEMERREIEHLLEAAHGKEVAQERAHRKALRDQKMKELELRKRLKRQRIRRSNGVVIAVTVEENISAFVDYLECTDVEEEYGESFEIALAEWMGVPQEAVEMEQGMEIEGTLVACVKINHAVVGAAEATWSKLQNLVTDSGRALKRTGNGITVKVVEVDRAGEVFIAEFTGRVGLLLQPMTKRDELEALEAQLDLPTEALTDFEIINITGTLRMNCFMTITKLVEGKVLEYEVGDLDLPGLTCSLQVEREDEQIGDGDSITVAGVMESILDDELKEQDQS